MQKYLALLKYSPLIFLYKLNIHVSTHINQSMQKSLTEKTGSILQGIECFVSLDFLFSTGRQKFSSEDGPVSREKAKETR